jgi:hypothetical protein
VSLQAIHDLSLFFLSFVSDLSFDLLTQPRACAHKATNDCKYWHVEMPFGNMMGHFDQFNTFFLDPDDVKTLKRGAFITAAYLDHGRRKIIYAEGGNSRVNYQGIHWYKTESEARHALEKVVSATRVNKG